MNRLPEQIGPPEDSMNEPVELDPSGLDELIDLLGQAVSFESEPRCNLMNMARELSLKLRQGEQEAAINAVVY
jgi:hypothetical protein